MNKSEQGDYYYQRVTAKLTVAGFVLSFIAFISTFLIWDIVFWGTGKNFSITGWILFIWALVVLSGLVCSIKALSRIDKLGGKKGLTIVATIMGIFNVVIMPLFLAAFFL